MLDLPRDRADRLRIITNYLTTCRVANLCRPGDRVIELNSAPSALVPLLMRSAVHPQSLTVLKLNGTSVSATRQVGDAFPVVSRVWDGVGRWPVAGPFDLVVHVRDDLATGAAMRTIENAADVLTLGGQLALAAPSTMSALPVALRDAGFTVDEVHGVAAPAQNAQVEQLLLDRFGEAAVALHRAMHVLGEPEFVRPAIAAALAGDAATVLRVCRRLR